MIKLHMTEDGRQQPWEYLPCSAITPKYGMAMTITAGKLALASGSVKPQYISMREESAAVAAGTIIPVIKVQPDQIYEAPAPSGLTVGVAYTLSGNGLAVTSTSTSGIFTVTDQDDSGDYLVRGRFL